MNEKPINTVNDQGWIMLKLYEGLTDQQKERFFGSLPWNSFNDAYLRALSNNEEQHKLNPKGEELDKFNPKKYVNDILDNPPKIYNSVENDGSIRKEV